MLAGEGLGGVMQALLAVAKVDGSRTSLPTNLTTVQQCSCRLSIFIQTLAPRLDALDSSFADECVWHDVSSTCGAVASGTEHRILFVQRTHNLTRAYSKQEIKKDYLVVHCAKMDHSPSHY